MASLAAPTLSTLPPEIILEIVSHCRFDSVIKLSRTSHLFHDLISSIPTPRLHNLLLTAETEPWAQRQRLLTCNHCMRLARDYDFSFRMKKNGRERGGKRASERMCDRCEATEAQAETQALGNMVLTDRLFWVAGLDRWKWRVTKSMR